MRLYYDNRGNPALIEFTWDEAREIVGSDDVATADGLIRLREAAAREYPDLDWIRTAMGAFDSFGVYIRRVHEPLAVYGNC